MNEGRAAINFLIGDQPAFKHSGIDVSPGDIVFDDLSFTHRRSFAPGRVGAMSLPKADLAVLGYTLAGCELRPPPIAQVLRPAPALMASLLTLHEAAGQLATTSPAKLAHPEIALANRSFARDAPAAPSRAPAQEKS